MFLMFNIVTPNDYETTLPNENDLLQTK